MNYNKVILMGNLTRDPELRHTQSGMPVCDFGMAINRKYKDEERTCFVDVTAWDKQANLIAEYLGKGDPIFVDGRLDFEQWETKEGNKRSRLRVTCERFQFVGRKNSAGGGGGTASAPPMPSEADKPDSPSDVPF